MAEAYSAGSSSQTMWLGRACPARVGHIGANAYRLSGQGTGEQERLLVLTVALGCASAQVSARPLPQA